MSGSPSLERLSSSRSTYPNAGARLAANGQCSAFSSQMLAAIRCGRSCTALARQQGRQAASLFAIDINQRPTLHRASVCHDVDLTMDCSILLLNIRHQSPLRVGVAIDVTFYGFDGTTPCGQLHVAQTAARAMNVAGATIQARLRAIPSFSTSMGTSGGRVAGGPCCRRVG